jgi:hypothetical protein
MLGLLELDMRRRCLRDHRRRRLLCSWIALVGSGPGVTFDWVMIWPACVHEEKFEKRGFMAHLSPRTQRDWSVLHHTEPPHGSLISGKVSRCAARRHAGRGQTMSAC